MSEKTDIDYIKKSLQQITELLYDTIKEATSGDGSHGDEEQIPYWSHKDDLLSILTKILVLKNKIITLDATDTSGDTFEFNEEHDREILANYVRKHVQSQKNKPNKPKK
ncbi:MAG: hypothetical protein MK137_08935 [Rickettsiales bacterium]|nr:hypothetical protein [Rickettsiales bacterium]